MSAIRRMPIVSLLAGLSVLLSFGTALSAAHNVSQVNLTFQPADITIQVGDTVVWTRTSGSHTVTNGTGAADPGAGTLFDAPLNASNLTFQFTFNTPGLVPYFCRPHEGFGMKGTITVEATTDVPGGPGLNYALMQSTPNPFRSTAKISYSIAQPERVGLRVFDATGRLVRILVDEYVSRQGVHDAVWNGRSDSGRQLPAGVYFYEINAGSFSAMRRMILVR